jgi:prepilin-type processing-associated H-X9-DG protein
MFMRVIIAVVLGLCAYTATAGGPLADRVPADALLYVGWQGTDALPDSYQQTRLHAICAQSDMAKLLGEFRQRVVAKISEEDPQAAETTDLITHLVDLALRKPWALYVGPGGTDMVESPVRVALIMQLGSEAATLAATLGKYLDRSGDLRVAAMGGCLVFTVGPLADDPALEKLLASGTGPALAADVAFKATASRTQPGALSQAYLNMPGVIALGDRLAAAAAPPADMQPEPPGPHLYWPRLRDVLALEKIRSVVWSCGFTGRDFTTKLFVDAPAPRTGLAAMLDAAPLDEATIAMIPSTAAMAGAATFDLAGLVRGILDHAATVEPQAGMMVAMMRAQATQQLGADPLDGLLGTLGSQWVYYADRHVAGASILGAVAVNRLADAQKLDQTLDVMIPQINALIAANMGDDGPTIRIRTSTIAGRKVRHLSTIYVNPSLLIEGGRLYLGLYPQAVIGAAEHAGSSDPGLAANAQFKALRQHVPSKAIQSFDYVDTEQMIDNSYQSALMLSQLGLGLGDMFGVESPAMVVPPLTAIREQLTPAGSFSWSDDAGLHMASRSPFPGASVAAGDPRALGVGGTAMSVGIMLPALGRAREIANRTVSAANLRGLYVACYTWSVTNDDNFPPHLVVLLRDGSLGPKSFINPRSKRRRTAQPAARVTDPAWMKWIDDNCDYKYLGGSANVAADEIVAYENPEGLRDGINILYGDGHVSFVSFAQAEKELAAQGIKLKLNDKQRRQSGRPSSAVPNPFEEHATAAEAGPAQAYFYDTVTTKVFTANADQIAPITSPAGNPAVRVHFYSFGNCEKESRFVGYYEKYTPEAKAKLDQAMKTQGDGTFEELMELGQQALISLDGKKWYPMDSAEAMQQLAARLTSQAGRRPRYCAP